MFDLLKIQIPSKLAVGYLTGFYFQYLFLAEITWWDLFSKLPKHVFSLLHSPDLVLFLRRGSNLPTWVEMLMPICLRLDGHSHGVKWHPNSPQISEKPVWLRNQVWSWGKSLPCRTSKPFQEHGGERDTFKWGGRAGDLKAVASAIPKSLFPVLAIEIVWTGWILGGDRKTHWEGIITPMGCSVFCVLLWRSTCRLAAACSFAV